MATKSKQRSVTESDTKKMRDHDRRLKDDEAVPARAVRGAEPTSGVPAAGRSSLDPDARAARAAEVKADREAGPEAGAVPFVVRGKDQFIDGRMYKPVVDGEEPNEEAGNIVMLTPERAEFLMTDACGCCLESEADYKERVEMMETATAERLDREQVERDARVGEEHDITQQVAEAQNVATRDERVAERQADANRNARSSTVASK